MFEQDSMTPPSSPLLQMQGFENEDFVKNITTDFSQLQDNNVDESNVPFCLDCLGECSIENCASTKHQQHHLERLFQEEFEFPLYSNTSIPLLLEEVDHQFLLIRKKCTRLEMLMSTCSSSSAAEMLEDRIHIRYFFNYILWSMKSCEEFWNTDPENFLTLVAHVKGLLLYTGRLSELPECIVSSAASKFGNKSSSVYHHMFHMHLEIHWAILEMLHYISVKYPQHINCINLCSAGVGETTVDGDLMSQALQLLLWDIVQLALTKYKLKNNHKDLLVTSPFVCNCEKNVFVMLRYLCEHRQQTIAKESLLMLLQPILQYIIKCSNDSSRMEIDDEKEINSDTFPVPPDIDCPDSVGFCLWLLMGIVPTFLCDITGVVNTGRLDKTHSQGFMYILQQLARKSISMPEVPLRSHLRYNLKIARYLDANTQVLAIFWDHFYKKLNDTYSLTSNTLGHLQSIQISATGLLERTQKIVVNDPQGIDTATSFVLFLHLLCVELQKSTTKKGSANPEWKSMKGRFYSKFHSRRMQELSELGLQHFSLLFLCLAQTADTQDVVQKLCDLYSTLPVTTLNTPKRTAMWRGCLATILYHIENDQDVSFLTEKMSASFNAVCSEISSSSTDPNKYSELWPLVQLYTDSTQDIIEMSSSLDLHQHKLISEGFQDVLKVCKDSDLRNILCFAEAVLTKHRILSRSNTSQTSNNTLQQQRLELSDALWKHFYSFVREHSTTLTPPNQLADLAAGFALLAIDRPPSVHCGMREDFTGCFGYFAWNENVNSKISCIFLCHLLPNQYAIDHLHAKLPGVKIKLIQAWIKCCLELSPQDQEIHELTRLIQKMPVIATVVKAASGIHSDWGIFNFIQSLSDHYSSYQDLRSKSEFRETISKYFAEVPKLVNVLLRNCLSAEKIGNVFKITGHLLKECANVLYLKSKPDCLLPILVDRLVLPRGMLVHNKPLPSHLMSGLKDNLHLFVQGLGKLDYKRDPFVQRKLKDILANYLTRFPLAGSHTNLTSSVHPLIMALNETYSKTVTEESSNFRRYFLDIVKSEYLTLRNTTGTNIPPNANIGWVYILSIFNRTTNTDEIAKDSVVLLRTALDYVLLVESLDLKGSATKIMQHLVESVARNPKSVNMSVLTSIIQKFFEAHIRLYQAVKVVRTLDSVALLCPDLLKPLIPVMTTAVKASEGKRGVGLDKQLRMAYYSLLTNLGEEGNEEKSLLLRNTCA